MPFRPFARLRLTPKLVLALSAFGLVPLLAVGALLYRAGERMRLAAATNLQTVAANVADKIDRNLFER